MEVIGRCSGLRGAGRAMALLVLLPPKNCPAAWRREGISRWAEIHVSQTIYFSQSNAAFRASTLLQDPDPIVVIDSRCLPEIDRNYILVLVGGGGSL